MKPVHICGSDDAITIGRTRFGGYALRNVTRVINCRTKPKLQAQLNLARAAHASYGRSWAELIANVASSCGNCGGLSRDQRRELKHRQAAGTIRRLEREVGGVPVTAEAGYAGGLPGLF